MIKLGSLVKDSLTGFKGVAVCRVEWLHGCARIGIEPQGLKKGDGGTADTQHFDEPRIIVVKEAKPGAFGTPVVEKAPKTGGPQRDER